tara:strand:- start:563 stop:2338 length:1776 start_codon:yes stop_codon:yes gene_type:complete
MPSSFTSRLKLERQASGENSGNWGNLVNFVLNRVDASVSGYQAVNVAGSANITLTSNNSTSNTDDSTTDDQVHNATLEFTGALTGDIHVFTDAVEQNYVVFNNTTGSQTLTFSNTGHAANGVALKQGAKTIVYTDGSTIFDVTKDLGDIQVTGLTSNGGATVTGNVDITGNVALKTAKALVFEDTSGGQFAALKANGTTTSYTLTLPPATGTADQIIKTDGSGNLSFADPEGGTEWQSSVKTANFNAASGEGYFVDTTSSAITATLPSSPAVGDTIEFVDFARKFATNALTIGLNGNKFQGSSTVTPSYEDNGTHLRCVYSGSTNGWLVTDDDIAALKVPVPAEYVVVAGGGSGGAGEGGGGGAGGFLTNFGGTAINLQGGERYTITVGGGGAGVSGSPKQQGTTGGDSSLSGTGITTITSNGGGGGGGASQNGRDGGSGGGASNSDQGGSGTSGQGNDGGDGTRCGGGGASAAAADGTETNGGDGLATSITGTPQTFAGGGGGGHGPTSGGAGGGTGGADNPNSSSPSPANTGGGSGGANDVSSGNGGSGIVILRLATSLYTGNITGSPNVSTSGSDTIIKFTGSGTYTA